MSTATVPSSGEGEGAVAHATPVPEATPAPDVTVPEVAPPAEPAGDGPGEPDPVPKAGEPADEPGGLAGVLDQDLSPPITLEQLRTRDPKTGKFLKAGEKPAKEPDKPAGWMKDGPPASGPDAVPAAEKFAGKFMFAGQEYDTQDAAEQRHRSLEGQFKPLQDARQAAEQVAQNLRQEVQNLRAQIQAGPAPAVPPAEPPKPPAEPDAFLQDDKVRATYQELAKLDPVGAQLFLAKQAADAAGRYAREQVEAAIEPIREFQGKQEVSQRAYKLVHEVAEFNKPGTQEPLFPELRDPVALREIGEILEGPIFAEDRRWTHQALAQAVYEYRGRNDIRGWIAAVPAGQQPPTAAPAGTPPPSEGATNAAAAVAALVAADKGGEAISGQTPPLVRPATNPTESWQETLKRETREASSINPDLGFDTEIEL